MKGSLLSYVQAVKGRTANHPQMTTPADTSSRDLQRVVTKTVIDLREPALDLEIPLIN